MTATATATATATTRGRIALWVLQIVLALFFLVAAGGPKLLGEATAVQMFNEMGPGDWFRYLVGGLEAAGAIGLVIRRLAGLAAAGLAALMVGATYTQAVVLDGGALTVTPLLLGVLFAVIAWIRRAEIAALLGR